MFSQGLWHGNNNYFISVYKNNGPVHGWVSASPRWVSSITIFRTWMVLAREGSRLNRGVHR